MHPLHYLIFHPDLARQRTEIQGRALIDNKLVNWQGYVWVDRPGGNEDPFVFSEKWLYSYCHATQLRRKPRSNAEYLKAGSHLFFCSGDAANNGFIQLDTIFVVDHVAEWPGRHQGLPGEFEQHYMNNDSEVWHRHFRYPFIGQHEGRYTYVSRHWSDGENEYSLLPVSKSGDRVTFQIGNVSPDLQSKIITNTHGKYPVMLEEGHKTELLEKTLSLTHIKVIGSLIRPSTDSEMTRSCTGREVTLSCNSKC